MRDGTGPRAGVEIGFGVAFEARRAATALTRCFLAGGRREAVMGRREDLVLTSAIVIDRVCRLLALAMSLVRAIFCFVCFVFEFGEVEKR